MKNRGQRIGSKNRSQRGQVLQYNIRTARRPPLASPLDSPYCNARQNSQQSPSAYSPQKQTREPSLMKLSHFVLHSALAIAEEPAAVPGGPLTDLDGPLWSCQRGHMSEGSHVRGVRSCNTTSGRLAVLPSLHRSTHRTVMHAKIVSNLLQRIAPRSKRVSHRF